VLRCLGAFIPTTTFIREITPLLQIRQFAHHRSASCSLQGLSPARRVARAAPSGDLALGVMHLVTLRSPGPEGGIPNRRGTQRSLHTPGKGDTMWRCRSRRFRFDEVECAGLFRFRTCGVRLGPGGKAQSSHGEDREVMARQTLGNADRKHTQGNTGARARAKHGHGWNGSTRH